LHRQVARTFLPASTLRRPKRGFAVNVVDDWFRSAVSNGLADILLDGESRMYRYLRPRAVQELFDQHSAGRQDNHKVLFSLVVLEQWLRAH
jgi:asparagine synthase (glutamine-hydrolysing)